MTTQLTRLARAVVEAKKAWHAADRWIGVNQAELALMRRIEDLAAELDRTHPESPDGSTQFDRALESDAELELPRPSESEAPPLDAPPCHGCGRPAGIAHAYGCEVLGGEAKP